MKIKKTIAHLVDARNLLNTLPHAKLASLRVQVKLRARGEDDPEHKTAVRAINKLVKGTAKTLTLNEAISLLEIA